MLIGEVSLSGLKKARATLRDPIGAAQGRGYG
jgi:hypothetical protein